MRGFVLGVLLTCMLAWAGLGRAGEPKTLEARVTDLELRVGVLEAPPPEERPFAAAPLREFPVGLSVVPRYDRFADTTWIRVSIGPLLTKDGGRYRGLSASFSGRGKWEKPTPTMRSFDLSVGVAQAAHSALWIFDGRRWEDIPLPPGLSGREDLLLRIARSTLTEGRATFGEFTVPPETAQAARLLAVMLGLTP